MIHVKKAMIFTAVAAFVMTGCNVTITNPKVESAVNANGNNLTANTTANTNVTAPTPKPTTEAASTPDVAPAPVVSPSAKPQTSFDGFASKSGIGPIQIKGSRATMRVDYMGTDQCVIRVRPEHSKTAYNEVYRGGQVSKAVSFITSGPGDYTIEVEAGGAWRVELLESSDVIAADGGN
jgi:hypothetical protein